MRVDPSYINNLVSALDNAQSNEQQYSSELSSGMRLTTIGTDPVAAHVQSPKDRQQRWKTD